MCNSVRTLSSRMIHSIVSPPLVVGGQCTIRHDRLAALHFISFSPPNSFHQQRVPLSLSLTDLYKVIFLYM